MSGRSFIGPVMAVVLSVISLPLRAADPEQQWFTITTPNFRVHVYRNRRHNLAKVGQRVATLAEHTHRILVPLLGNGDGRPTHIVVSDDTDGANGLAQSLPYNVVRVFVSRPGSMGSLNDFDDWLYGLLIHEYTHILHMNTIGGIPRWANAVFGFGVGRVWAPNQLQPGWFVEGLATYEESARTSAGRIRSNIVDMVLRTATLEGRFLSIDQISSSPRQRPRGDVRYLYGGRFIDYIAQRFGEAKLTALSVRYGKTPIPYGINRVAQQVLGHTFVSLYRDFRASLVKRYREQLHRIQKRGLTPFERLTTHGESVASPRYSADRTELIYTVSDGHRRAEHVILSAATKQRRQGFYQKGDSDAAITPDGRHLVVAQRESVRTFYQYSDLYVLERKTRQTRRLTREQRARSPAVSPDGKQVVFVANELGQRRLMIIPFAGGKARTLFEFDEFNEFDVNGAQQIYAPRWSPNGRQVVFSAWLPGGYRDLFIFDTTSTKVRRLTSDRAIDASPVFSADGQRVYFSSDRSGIYNVYCLALDTMKLQQVTNVIGGAFSPAVSADETELIFVGYSTRGYDLHRMPLARQSFLAAAPYRDTRPAAPTLPESRSYPVTRYRPWRSLYPVTWAATFGTDSAGGRVGIELEGNDAVGRHGYLLRTDVGTQKAYPRYAVRYGYQGFWPSLSLNTSRSEGPRSGLQLDGRSTTYVEQAYGGGASIGLPVLRIPDHSLTLSLGYQLRWFRTAEPIDVLVEPGALSPRLPRTGVQAGASFGASYGNVERYAWSVSAERGRRLSMGLTVNNEPLGSDFESISFRWSWIEYLPIPWWNHHVIALRLAGGISQGDNDRRGRFAIGGFPEQDLLEAVIDFAPLGGSFLRGYAPGVVAGDQFHLLNVEYRLPLFEIDRGPSTIPLYLTHVHLALFSDVGNAFNGAFDPEHLKVGAGGELLLEWQIFYVQHYTLRAGYAYGLMHPGDHEFHILLGNKF